MGRLRNSACAAKSIVHPSSGTVMLTACMLVSNGDSSQSAGAVENNATSENQRKLRQPYWRAYTGTIAAANAVYAHFSQDGIRYAADTRITSRRRHHVDAGYTAPCSGSAASSPPALIL